MGLSESDRELKVWETQQRQAYRKGKLSPSQIRKLTERGFIFELPDTAAENKRKLLEMADNRDQKPTHKTKLGKCLASYISKSSPSYDEDFYQKIHSLNPHWFESKTISKKKELLEMAERGDPKPDYKHPLGFFFRAYTKKSFATFDKKFTRRLKKANPNWFSTTDELWEERKSAILKLAKKTKFRPSQHSGDEGNKRMARWINAILTKTNPYYDPEFDAKIRTLRPDWFKKGRD